MLLDRLIGLPEVWGAHIYGDACSLVCLTPVKIKKTKDPNDRQGPTARILHVFSGSINEALEFAQEHGLDWKGVHLSSSALKVLWRSDPDQIPEMDKDDELRIPGEFDSTPVWIMASAANVEPQSIPLNITSYRSVRPAWPFQTEEFHKPEWKDNVKVILDFDGENLLCWFFAEGHLKEFVSLFLSEENFAEKLHYLLTWYRPGIHGEPAPEIAGYTNLVPETAITVIQKCFSEGHCHCLSGNDDQLIQEYFKNHKVSQVNSQTEIHVDNQENHNAQSAVPDPGVHWACRNALQSMDDLPSNVIAQKNPHIPARYDYWFGLYRYTMIAVFLLFITLAGYTGVQAGWNAIVSNQNGDLLSQGRTNQALAQKISAVQDSLQEEQKAFRDVLLARSQITSLLNNFRHTVPDSVWITQWDIRSAVNHSIQGYTTSNSKLTVFQRKLEQSPKMKSVRILESESISSARAEQLFGVDAFPDGLVAFSIRAGSR